MAGAGDINGDGFDDAIVGAPNAGNNSRFMSGSAYVIYGQASPANVDLASLGSAGFRIDGALAGDGAGRSVSGAGDVDGDGLDDLIVGAPNADNNSRGDFGSAYIIRPFRSLAVQLTGTGDGSVSSSPAGIDCGLSCALTVEPGTTITLTATPAANSTFAGWSGACYGSDPTCAVTLDRTKSVTATFDLIPRELTVAMAGSGEGSVSSSPAGIDCSVTCDFEFSHGTVVTLTATPLAGSTFTGWSGACSHSDLTCVVTMDQALQVTATFTRDEVPSPTVPANPPNDSTAIYDSASGKLKIRLKCGSQCKPKCLTMIARAVTGKAKRAKVMSNQIKVKNRKAGKWGYAPLKIKPKFRQQVQNMGDKTAKTLWVQIDVAWRKKGKKLSKTVHHRYRVLVRQ